jgi:hypothetical protein
MSPADRRSLGRAGLTASEAQAKYATRVERDEAKLFSAWLSGRELYFIQARTDRRSTIRTGHPDFTLLHDGRCLLLEIEMSARSAEPGTGPVSERTRSAGFVAEIVRSAAHAIETTKHFFGLV